MPPEDFYADAAAPEPTTMPEQEPEPTEGESDSETAVIPKSALGGRECKPGEKLTFEVTDVMEDSVVARFTGYGDEESYDTEETEPAAAPPPAAAPGPMSAMME